MNEEKETEAENGEWQIGSVYPEESNSNAEGICIKYRNGSNAGLKRDAEWCKNQGPMIKSEKETKIQNLGDQILHIRDTSGKRGSPAQLGTLVQREPININIAGIGVDVEELDRLKLDIPAMGQGYGEPRRG